MQVIRDYKDLTLRFQKLSQYEKLKDLEKDWSEFVRATLIHK